MLSAHELPAKWSQPGHGAGGSAARVAPGREKRIAAVCWRAAAEPVGAERTASEPRAPLPGSGTPLAAVAAAGVAVVISAYRLVALAAAFLEPPIMSDRAQLRPAAGALLGRLWGRLCDRVQRIDCGRVSAACARGLSSLMYGKVAARFTAPGSAIRQR